MILENIEYVELKKDDNDSRHIIIALTPKGRAYYEKRAEQENDYLKQLFNGFDDETLSGLYSGLHRLMKNAIQIETNSEN